MAYHEKTSKTKASLAGKATKIAVLVALGVAVILAFVYRDSVTANLSKVLAASEEDPIPVAKLTKEGYDLTVSATGEIVGMETVPVTTPTTSAGSLKVAWLIPEGTFVQPGDTVIRFDSTDAVTNLERQQNTLTQNLESTNITTSNQATNDKVMNFDRETAQLDYDYSMAILPDDETIFSKWEIITAKLDASLAQGKIAFLGTKAKVNQRVARSDQQILNIERSKAQSDISRTQQTLNSLELKAPVGGLALWVRQRRVDPAVGDEAQPGQSIVEIINLSVLQARIYVLERDGGNLAKDQGVLIRLDAIPDKVYHGVIRNLTATAQSLERNSPLRYFTCDVMISDAGEDVKKIRPGMNVRGDVLLAKYDSCFVVPATAVTTNKDNKYIVYVQNKDTFEPKEVETGMSTHGQAVILKGIEEGAVVALRNPFETRKLTLPDFSKGGSAQQQRGGPGGGGDRGMMMMMGGGGGGGRTGGGGGGR
jgi:HlyD family secretion protein